MGIYFRDILLISISRGANNCGQHSLEKNIYFIMRFSPHLQLFYFSDRLEFCEFFEWKIKRINNADLFSQTTFLTFIKGANISGGHCRCSRIKMVPIYKCLIYRSSFIFILMYSFSYRHCWRAIKSSLLEHDRFSHDGNFLWYVSLRRDTRFNSETPLTIAPVVSNNSALILWWLDISSPTKAWWCHRPAGQITVLNYSTRWAQFSN